MIGIFKQKSPANILLLLVSGVLLKYPLFAHPRLALPAPGDGALYQAILRFLEPAGRPWPLLYSLLSFGLLFTQALQINFLVTRQRMMSRPNYLPGISYLLVTSLLPEWNYLSAPLLINTILLVVLSALLKTYAQPEARGVIFNAGMATGIASFIFFPALGFLFWVLLAIAVMRPFRLVEWVLALVGAATPFYFYASYLFLTDQWSWSDIWPAFGLHIPALVPGLWLAGSFFLLLAPFIIGGYYIQENLRKMLIQVRKAWSLLLLFLLGALLIPFVNASDNLANWVIAVIPFAAFHGSGYLYSTYRILPLLFFWLTVAYVLGFQYAGPGW